MPTRDTTPAGAPCWIDLMSSDTARSRSYYAKLLGWGAEDPNAAFGGYFNFTKDGVLVAGGMGSQPGDGPSDVWSVYLAVDDAAKTTELAEANGATVIAPPMAVADLGTMAVLIDPTGASIGLWQPGTHKGFGVVAEAGAPGWFELHTRDYDAAVRFYTEVFGWQVEPMPDSGDMRYATKMGDEGPEAGIMDASGFLPEGMPSSWSIYFVVPDTDAALELTIAEGGSVIMPAEDTPFGRMATVLDPNGALLRLIDEQDDRDDQS